MCVYMCRYPFRLLIWLLIKYYFCCFVFVAGRHSVCVCVCACLCGLWHGYYKKNVIYENIFSVPIIQKAYKSYRMSFFAQVKMHKVSCKG